MFTLLACAEAAARQVAAQAVFETRQLCDADLERPRAGVESEGHDRIEGQYAVIAAGCHRTAKTSPRHTSDE